MKRKVMKKYSIVLCIGLLLLSGSVRSQSIAQLTEQLALDVEKLSELKTILQDMYKSYEIIDKGYTDIKNIAEGNFNLHQVFLDGLLAVSPTVRKYAKVADIIDAEATLVKEYKAAYSNFQSFGHFSYQELGNLSDVYTGLLKESLKNLDELAMVLTDNELRMSDDERLGAIDRLHSDMKGKLSFLRNFNKSASVQALQRARDAGDVEAIKSLYGLP